MNKRVIIDTTSKDIDEETQCKNWKSMLDNFSSYEIRFIAALEPNMSTGKHNYWHKKTVPFMHLIVSFKVEYGKIVSLSIQEHHFIMNLKFFHEQITERIASG